MTGRDFGFGGEEFTDYLYFFGDGSGDFGVVTVFGWSYVPSVDVVSYAGAFDRHVVNFAVRAGVVEVVGGGRFVRVLFNDVK